MITQSGTAQQGNGASTSIRPAADGSEAGSAVDKALLLLRLFGGSDAVGVSELSRRAALSKSTTFRLLATLQRHGFVEREGCNYRLGATLHDLGRRVYEDHPGQLRDVVLPHLTQLYEATHETIHLAVLRGTDVVYLEKLYGRRLIQGPSRVGARVPAYCTAIGKMLLSRDEEAATRAVAAGLPRRTSKTITESRQFFGELERIRTTGIAYDDEEAAYGLICAAVPIVDGAGRPVAALSLSGACGRFDPRQAAHDLRSVAAGASLALKRSQVPAQTSGAGR